MARARADHWKICDLFRIALNGAKLKAQLAAGNALRGNQYRLAAIAVAAVDGIHAAGCRARVLPTDDWRGTDRDIRRKRLH